jgi:ankyrin repeat protein
VLIDMAKPARVDERAFFDFVRAVVNESTDDVARHLRASPQFASMPAATGATRDEPSRYFFDRIAHYLYAGDTALHMAAAAFRRSTVELLVARGADVRAKNRRGAEPLHYAADANHWDPAAQAETIEYLISAGADPDADDKSGTTALHRAVRTRSAAAVKALLDGGADPRKRNTHGSTPLHLAVQPTGRGGSNSPRAREQELAIIALLLEHGARPADRDSRGKRAHDVAVTRVRHLV